MMIAYIIIHIIAIIIGMCLSRLMMSIYGELRYEANKIRTKKAIRILQVCSLLGPVGLMAYCFGFIIYVIIIEFKYFIKDLKEIWK